MNMISRYLVLIFVSCGSLVSCEEEETLNDENDSRRFDVITVDLNTEFQTIRGFGACNTVFNGVQSFPNESDMKKAYGQGDDELGLSIFRVSIPPTQTTWSAIATVAKYAQDRGAIVFASPWDAPDEMIEETNGEPRLRPDSYPAYVDHLNEYDDFMAENGVELYAISVQNEPDIGEWTQWSVSAVESFMREYAGGINNRVITPESFNFNRTYYNGLLSNEQALENFEIVGGHIYGGGLGEIPLAEAAGKEIWMTEYLLNDFESGVQEKVWSAFTDEEKWDQTMEMLNTIHVAMESNWNAYIWWYLKRYYSFIGEGQLGAERGEILKRGYAFSHFSKYIRPGYVRVATERNRILDPLQITAYKGEGKTVVQVINPTDVNQAFLITIPEKAISSVDAYTTNVNQNRTALEAQLEDDGVSARILARSINTFIIE